MEIIGRVSGRRHWTVEQKLAILRDAFGPEGSVRAAIERHEIGSGAIYTWRRQAMSGALTGITRPAVPELCRGADQRACNDVAGTVIGRTG